MYDEERGATFYYNKVVLRVDAVPYEHKFTNSR